MMHSRRALLALAAAVTAFWGKVAVARQGGPQDDAAKAAVRNAEVLGKPPRIAPLPQEKIPTEVRDAMNRLRAGINLPPYSGPISEFPATSAKSPALMAAHLTLADFLFHGTLPVRDREMAVLRIGWLSGAPYEWGEHVDIFKRLAGGTQGEVVRIRQGSSAPGWTDHERAVLKGVEEMIDDAMISDETWAVLAGKWTEPQLLEFPILVGQYRGVAYLQNSVRVRLQKDNPGLTAT